MDGLTMVHVVAGATGLVVAIPVSLLAKRRGGWHARLGRVFASLGLVVAATALVLVARDPGELVGLGVLGILTGSWSGAGWWLARRRPSLPGGWRVWHLVCMGSAVIGFVTAFAVQLTDGNLVAWIAPTVIGSVVNNRAVRRHRRVARPAGPTRAVATVTEPAITAPSVSP